MIGDRIGFRPVLIAALGGAGAGAVPDAAGRDRSGLWRCSRSCLGAATATVSSMIFGLLATELPADRRSAALNLVYLPLYAAGIVGPAGGRAGRLGQRRPRACSSSAAAVFLFGAVTILSRRGPATAAATEVTAGGPAADAGPVLTRDQPGRRRDDDEPGEEQRDEASRRPATTASRASTNR